MRPRKSHPDLAPFLPHPPADPVTLYRLGGVRILCPEQVYSTSGPLAIAKPLTISCDHHVANLFQCRNRAPAEQRRRLTGVPTKEVDLGGAAQRGFNTHENVTTPLAIPNLLLAAALPFDINPHGLESHGGKIANGRRPSRRKYINIGCVGLKTTPEAVDIL